MDDTNSTSVGSLALLAVWTRSKLMTKIPVPETFRKHGVARVLLECGR
jgi:hypothetical protein